MKVLAIDTSNQPMSIALVEDDTLKATTTLNTVLNHSIYVLPTIDNLFKRVGWEPQDIDRVVVAKGPGSYCGKGAWFLHRDSDCGDDGQDTGDDAQEGTRRCFKPAGIGQQPATRCRSVDCALYGCTPR